MLPTVSKELFAKTLGVSEGVVSGCVDSGQWMLEYEFLEQTGFTRQDIDTFSASWISGTHYTHRNGIRLINAKAFADWAQDIAREARESPAQGERRKKHVDAPTALYRHFDAEGVLLYVGISMSVFSRTQSHGVCAAWWDRVARIDIERYPDRKSAEEAEREAIKIEGPLHNKAHREASNAAE